MLAESYNHQQGEEGEILERLEAANIDTEVTLFASTIITPTIGCLRTIQ